MSTPITPGFPWACPFDFEPGWLQPSDKVRAEFRKGPGDAEQLASVEAGAGTRVDGDQVIVELTADQTTQMKPDSVVTNFVVERSGRELVIGQLITIQVAVFPTRRRA